jgi:hypothetical protein
MLWKIVNYKTYKNVITSTVTAYLNKVEQAFGLRQYFIFAIRHGFRIRWNQKKTLTSEQLYFERIILKFHRTLLCPLITTKIERIPPP